MLDVLERSPADVALSVTNIMIDLRAHRIDSVAAAEIQEAAGRSLEEDEEPPGRYSGTIVLCIILAALLALWCAGVL